MNQKKVLGLLFALIATVFMFILVVSALPSDVYETPRNHQWRNLYHYEHEKRKKS